MLQVGNPLGSKAGINKMTMYYIQILNIPNLSSLSNIHLALVAYSSDVKQFGHASVLRPLINDLKKLEEGIDVEAGDQTVTVFGTVVTLPADNLAANELQGFVGSFSANYFCRFCKMLNSHTHSACAQDSSLLRTIQGHKTDILEASMSTSGVKCACAFDELKYFEPIESFTPDVMHDIFEGIGK